MSDEKVNNPRAEIDAIDSQLLRLLNRRAEIALRVGAAKSSGDAALCDAAAATHSLGTIAAAFASQASDGDWIDLPLPPALAERALAIA